ncbi:MAG: DUF167 domain-containing protein [Desulfobacterales bacterium]
MLSIQQHPSGLSFKVRIQPKSSRNMVAGVREDALKVKLTAPPVEGAANKMCIRFLSERLGVPRSALEILSGQAARNKTILVRCASSDIESIQRRIQALQIE